MRNAGLLCTSGVYELKQLLWHGVKWRVWTTSRGQSVCKNEINSHVETQVAADNILVL